MPDICYRINEQKSEWKGGGQNVYLLSQAQAGTLGSVLSDKMVQCGYFLQPSIFMFKVSNTTTLSRTYNLMYPFLWNLGDYFSTVWVLTVSVFWTSNFC